MRCKPTCKWVSGVIFLANHSTPFGTIVAQGIPAQKLAASMLQTEIVPGLDLPLNPHAGHPLLHLAALVLCPSPHFPTLRLRPITPAFLSPDAAEDSWPRQPSNRVNPRLSIYLHLCLPSPGGFLASWDQQLPFSWPHFSNESPSPLPSFTKWQQKWNISL